MLLAVNLWDSSNHDQDATEDIAERMQRSYRQELLSLSHFLSLHVVRLLA
jgi:hypothetical protein